MGLDWLCRMFVVLVTSKSIALETFEFVFVLFCSLNKNRFLFIETYIVRLLGSFSPEQEKHLKSWRIQPKFSTLSRRKILKRYHLCLSPYPCPVSLFLFPLCSCAFPLFSCQRLSHMLIYKQPLYHFKDAPEYVDQMNVAESPEPPLCVTLRSEISCFILVMTGWRTGLTSA